MSELYENWYDGFLAQTDQTLRVEEYEPMITFAKAKRTPLQGIIRYGGITYNLQPGQAINAKDYPLHEKAIQTDIHKYRVRLKYPEKVKVSSYIAGDGGAISAAGTKFDGRVVPTGYGVLKLSTYNRGPSGSDLYGLPDARAVVEDDMLENQTTHEVYTVMDVDTTGNAILIRRASTSDPHLPGTYAGGNAPSANDILFNQGNAIQENDFASKSNGLEKTAWYENYAQFLNVTYGQSISAEHIKFQGGDPMKAMNLAKNEELGWKTEVALLWGQGKRILDPQDETNSRQTMQGIIPMLMNGPEKDNLVVNLNGSFSTDSFNEFLDRVNLTDSSDAPCLASKRLIRALNNLDRDKIRITPKDTASGIQLYEWKSDFGVQRFIYEPFLDERKTFLSNGSTQAYVDCIKYDFDAYAKLCKLCPLTLRTDIGKYTGATILKTWMYMIITAEWSHPECGGLLCNVVNPA